MGMIIPDQLNRKDRLKTNNYNKFKSFIIRVSPYPKSKFSITVLFVFWKFNSSLKQQLLI